MEPTWYALPDFLIEQFPALRHEIEAEYFSYLNSCADPMPHFFLGTFLAPILLGQHFSVTAAERAKAGEILDRVLAAPDEDLAAAALTEVVELLADNPPLRLEAWPFLGPVARGWLERLERT